MGLGLGLGVCVRVTFERESGEDRRQEAEEGHLMIPPSLVYNDTIRAGLELGRVRVRVRLLKG